jgi:plasmid stability protein
MPRTTLMIDDSLFRTIRKKAASEGRTMQALVNDLLRQALKEGTQSKPYEFKWTTWDAQLQPGIEWSDIGNNARLLDIMEGE